MASQRKDAFCEHYDQEGPENAVDGIPILVGQVVQEPYQVPRGLERFKRGVRYVRAFVKVSSKGKELERVLCLCRGHLLLCTLDTTIRRLVSMKEIESVVHYVRSNTPVETLIRCKHLEHDIVLRHVVLKTVDQPDPSLQEMYNLSRALQAMYHKMMGRELTVCERTSPVASVACLRKCAGYMEPRQKIEKLLATSRQNPFASIGPVAGIPIRLAELAENRHH